jgi:hypothetical protein
MFKRIKKSGLKLQLVILAFVFLFAFLFPNIETSYAADSPSAVPDKDTTILHGVNLTGVEGIDLYYMDITPHLDVNKNNGLRTFRIYPFSGQSGVNGLPIGFNIGKEAVVNFIFTFPQISVLDKKTNLVGALELEFPITIRCVSWFKSSLNTKKWYITYGFEMDLFHVSVTNNEFWQIYFMEGKENALKDVRLLVQFGGHNFVASHFIYDSSGFKMAFTAEQDVDTDQPPEVFNPNDSRWDVTAGGSGTSFLPPETNIPSVPPGGASVKSGCGSGCAEMFTDFFTVLKWILLGIIIFCAFILIIQLVKIFQKK